MSCYMSYEIVIKSDKKETVISAMNEFIKRNYCEDEFNDDIKHVEDYYILRKTSTDSFYSSKELFKLAGRIARKYVCQIEIITESVEANCSEHYYHDGQKSICEDGIQRIYGSDTRDFLTIEGYYSPFFSKLSEEATSAYSVNPSLLEKWFGFHPLTVEVPDYYIGKGYDNTDRYIDLSMYNKLKGEPEIEEENELDDKEDLSCDLEDNEEREEVFCEYDDEGKLLRERYCGGYEIWYEYKKGRLFKERDSEGNKVFHFYDDKGNQCRKICSNPKDQIIYDTDFKKKEVWYGYDDKGEQTYKINKQGEEYILEEGRWGINYD